MNFHNLDKKLSNSHQLQYLSVIGYLENQFPIAMPIFHSISGLLPNIMKQHKNLGIKRRRINVRIEKEEEWSEGRSIQIRDQHETTGPIAQRIRPTKLYKPLLSFGPQNRLLSTTWRFRSARGHRKEVLFIGFRFVRPFMVPKTIILDRYKFSYEWLLPFSNKSMEHIVSIKYMRFAFLGLQNFLNYEGVSSF